MYFGDIVFLLYLLTALLALVTSEIDSNRKKNSEILKFVYSSLLEDNEIDIENISSNFKLINHISKEELENKCYIVSKY